MTVTESDFEDANAWMENRLATKPRAVAARFDAERSEIVLDLGDDTEFSFSTSKSQVLEGATVAELSEIEVSPAGLGLHWPKLEADLYIPALLNGVFGR